MADGSRSFVNDNRLFFTDTAAILNLLDLRSIMGCTGALAQYLRALFGQKENFNVYFSTIIITFKHGTTIFFPITIFFEENVKKNQPKKRAYIY